MDQKKAKELLYINLFKEQFVDFPAGEIVPHETPDCLVRGDSRCVGIEVTRIFRDVADHSGQQLQIRESELQHIVQAARAMHKSSGLPPVAVGVYFSRRYPFRRDDRVPIANSLVEIVRRNMPDRMGRREVHYDPAESYFS